MLNAMGAPAKSISRGFTLIELMVTMAVFALLLFLALPNYQTWIQNTQVRTAAEAFQNGVQLARAEAVRRNTVIQFQLLGGTRWTVGCDLPVADNDGDGVDDCPAVLQTRATEEGGTTSVTPVVTPGGATTVTFNGLGRVIPNTDASPSITQVDVDSNTLDPADSRELRITIAPGGAVKMCDPQVADAADPRACP